MKRFPLMALFAATLTLGGCSALDDLAQEAVNWLEDTRGENPLAAVEDPSNYDNFHEGDYQGDPFFDSNVDNRDDFGSEVFFFPIAGESMKNQRAVAELEFDDDAQDLYLYLEFERNDAFIPLEPDPASDDMANKTWAFTAIPNFNETQGTEFQVFLNWETGVGELKFGEQTAKLLTRGQGNDLRVIGINLPSKGDYGFHAEENPDGILDN
jgi:hypothetical protein